MAGDWIKVQTCTPDKPEVFKMARCLGIERDTVVGKLVRFWSWLDQVCVDGYVDGLSSQDVDGIVGQADFSTALIEVNWVEFDLNDHGQEIGFSVMNFENHNGKSSKNRALKTERQRKWRHKKPVDGQTSTREEKRRVLRKTKAKRFDDWWMTYPKKVKKKSTKEKWEAKQLDEKADVLIADVQNRIANDGRWLEGFVPDPTTYLSQERWEDEISPSRVNGKPTPPGDGPMRVLS